MHIDDVWRRNTDNFEMMPTQTEVLGMWCLSRSQCTRTRCTEHVTNVEELNQAGIKKQLCNKLQIHKLIFFGHIIRQRGIERELLAGMMDGKSKGKTKSYMDGQPQGVGENTKI